MISINKIFTPDFKGLIILDQKDENKNSKTRLAINTNKIYDIYPAIDIQNACMATNILLGGFKAKTDIETEKENVQSKDNIQGVSAPVEKVIAAYQEAQKNGISYLYEESNR